MRYLFLIILLFYNKTSFADVETNCEGVLAKLKTDCNIVGKSIKKMKEFSKENKTINQSIDNIKKKIK